ncbi:vitamin K-dependent gamma-carboxylase [Fadolivirus algeromassiliense]|uniref:Vitamin K-dependent gamma-carboxylase n=1 Tax=Fadolivirus FV1/VV64 TaxID=3070911 RepID=A0A7D3UQJ9_9VIRU|nr:vitamin K-dependent gamma-carboxylase [Fadolivirus algeromassiliense]QKF94488.1 vitamin K-dependent gamma-carboxylase [Fadolivirus FV1/VV64]
MYLTVHFACLVPYAEELFGTEMPFDYTLSPLHGMFPNVLNYVNATYFLMFLTGVATMLMFEIWPRLSAFVLWYGWAALFNKNPLISNPGLAYVGWCLLALTLVERDPQRIVFNTSNWFLQYIQRDKFPKRVFWAGWILLAAGYTASGLHKLVASPSWVDGTALQHVLESCLARDNILRDTLLQFPTFLRYSTWFSLFLEIAFLPLGVFYYTRMPFWFIYIGFHLGILMLINFADLTIGVLMIHLFTFDWSWTTTINRYIAERIQSKREAKYGLVKKQV